MRRYGLRFGVAVCCFVTAVAIVWSWGVVANLKMRWFGPSVPTADARLGTTADPNDTRVDDEVYAAVLREKFLQQGPELVVIKAEISQNARLESMQSLEVGRSSVAPWLSKGFLPELEEKTLDDYLRANSADPSLTITDLGTPFVMVTDTDLPRDSTGSFWTKFTQKYPEAIGIITFSKIGFNREHDQAFLHVDFLSVKHCGSGNYFLLSKVAGQWRIVKEKLLWIS
jgi:hypothetical protein